MKTRNLGFIWVFIPFSALMLYFGMLKRWIQHMVNITKKNSRIFAIYTTIVGIWLILAPFILNYASKEATRNDIVSGAIILALSLLSLATVTRMYARWLILIVGVWLFISPFALSYGELTAVWNDFILGLMTMALHTWGISSKTSPQLKHV